MNYSQLESAVKQADAAYAAAMARGDTAAARAAVQFRDHAVGQYRGAPASPPPPLSATAAPPPPAPTPPPGAWGGPPAVQRRGPRGNPIDQYGNRMDTPAGQRASSMIMENAQRDVALQALKVAESQAAHGNRAAYETAANIARQATERFVKQQYEVKNNLRMQGKEVSYENVNKFQKDVMGALARIQAPPEPETPTPTTTPTPTPTPISQPSVFRPSAPRSAPPPPRPRIVKNPNRDVIDLSRDEFSVSSISRLLYDDIGSIELVNIARRETIEGQNPYYTLISNLSSIRKNFDPTSIIARQKSNENIYSNYTISLNEKIPDDEYLDRNNLSDFYYIEDNGDLVIELDNLENDEIIDFEIAESGTINLVDEA